MAYCGPMEVIGTRAHEVEALIETARKCGYVADRQLFDYIFCRVYADPMNGFSGMMEKVLEKSGKEE